MDTEYSYRRRVEWHVKVGDLVELSSYGKNIQENREYVDKVGVIMSVSDVEGMRFTHSVIWFGAGNKAQAAPQSHPRRDLKHLTNKKS